jgi:hypothetical protein
VTRPPSKAQRILARLVVGLSLAGVLFGLVMYGVSAEVLTRIWQNMLDRPDGPFVFRFVLQPIMATLAAVRDGLHDARTGRSPFLWTVITDPAQRRGRLDEALIATSRIVLLGLAIDVVYQIIEFDSFHPAESVLIALLLAFLPYLLLRGLVARIASRRLAGQAGRDKR